MVLQVIYCQAHTYSQENKKDQFLLAFTSTTKQKTMIKSSNWFKPKFDLENMQTEEEIMMEFLHILKHKLGISLKKTNLK